MSDNPITAAKKIKMLILDVDGVMTDGGLYYDDSGRITKRFNVQDGLGIKMAQACNLELGVLTGLTSQAVETRVMELGIRHYFHGFTHKIPVLRQLCSDTGIDLNEVAYLGDDWVDAGPMLHVGFPMAVANAQPEIKKTALWTSSCSGGHGAVREAIMFILRAQDKLDDQWKKWIDPGD